MRSDTGANLQRPCDLISLPGEMESGSGSHALPSLGSLPAWLHSSCVLCSSPDMQRWSATNASGMPPRKARALSATRNHALALAPHSAAESREGDAYQWEKGASTSGRGEIVDEATIGSYA